MCTGRVLVELSWANKKVIYLNHTTSALIFVPSIEKKSNTKAQETPVEKDLDPLLRKVMDTHEYFDIPESELAIDFGLDDKVLSEELQERANEERRDVFLVDLFTNLFGSSKNGKKEDQAKPGMSLK